jgi:hypothetical protein
MGLGCLGSHRSVVSRRQPEHREILSERACPRWRCVCEMDVGWPTAFASKLPPTASVPDPEMLTDAKPVGARLPAKAVCLRNGFRLTDPIRGQGGAPPRSLLQLISIQPPICRGRWTYGELALECGASSGKTLRGRSSLQQPLQERVPRAILVFPECLPVTFSTVTQRFGKLRLALTRQQVCHFR